MAFFTDEHGYKSSDIDAHLNDEKVKAELRRIEWTSLKYQALYHPQSAFDFELNWIVATGGLLYEMVSVTSAVLHVFLVSLMSLLMLAH